jgi:transposase
MMAGMRRRYGLKDEEWDKIAPLLPGKIGDRGVSAHDNRLFVDAVLWRFRSGAPWNKLPAHYGGWKAVNRRFHRWKHSGIWEQIFEYLDINPKITRFVSDSK